tara:strand:- start:10911 stop:11261 length:351 start_codon:yes stop_codon:yes gene_type:complete
VSKINHNKFGLIAEIIAVIFLKFKFYKILQKNYRNKLGEIDIIAVKNGVLVAVEVKARRKIRSFEEILTKNQMNRIKRSMNTFYSKKKYYAKFDIRFDLIIIRPYKFPQHFKNFWN